MPTRKCNTRSSRSGRDNTCSNLDKHNTNTTAVCLRRKDKSNSSQRLGTSLRRHVSFGRKDGQMLT